MVGILEESGYEGEIKVAKNFNEASRIILMKQPDLVLLDINLPGKSGIDLLRKMNEWELKSRVIMISNHDNEYYRKQCLELGASAFLDKSSDFSLVPTLIDQMN
ncbi:MAG: hypothetical protein C5B52_12365 [Bacteroidetes bacterium]|nr:MAG: hypothetical protein C5B52_12365 [Bacteroidota bacterium]